MSSPESGPESSLGALEAETRQAVAWAMAHYPVAAALLQAAGPVEALQWYALTGVLHASTGWPAASVHVRLSRVPRKVRIESVSGTTEARWTCSLPAGVIDPPAPPPDRIDWSKVTVLVTPEPSE